MIQATIVRDRASDRIEGFTISGHAEYAESGRDIVCAGVSTAAFGTLNAVQVLLGVDLPQETDEVDGLLKVNVPKQEDPRRERELQLLLESMKVMLDSIEQSYGQYMKITTIRR